MQQEGIPANTAEGEKKLPEDIEKLAADIEAIRAEGVSAEEENAPEEDAASIEARLTKAEEEISSLKEQILAQLEGSESAEDGSEKPLAIGDEVTRDGVTYKILSFTPEYDTDPVIPGRAGEIIQKNGPEKRSRSFKGIIVSGGFGGGTGGMVPLTEDSVTRVTPSIKAKLRDMNEIRGAQEKSA